jgi:hypothetical protein
VAEVLQDNNRHQLTQEPHHQEKRQSLSQLRLHSQLHQHQLHQHLQHKLHQDLEETSPKLNTPDQLNSKPSHKHQLQPKQHQ